MSANPSNAAALWVAAYYPGNVAKTLPVEEIDFSVVTHVIYFALVPNADGSLNETANGIESENARDLVTKSHAAGRKVLICVGGSASAQGFEGATTLPARAQFVANLVSFMAKWNYDGIDLDWEPLADSDFPRFTNLVLDLRAAFKTITPLKMLTAAVSAYPIYGDAPDAEGLMLASLQGQFDQINIMTFDLAGAYPGWVSWFNSPIYDGGARFPSSGNLLPSTDGSVKTLVAKGVLPAKLGIGVAFYGDLWAGGAGTPTGGVSLPCQSWKTAPIVTQIPYSEIMSRFYKTALYHWRTNEQAAYLSIDKPGAADDKFITYDDERACAAKVKYARDNHLGGLMIWQLAQGHRPDQPAATRDPLIGALGRAISRSKTP